MSVFFDHLVVAAQTLEEGNKWVNLHTGVSVPSGGKHILMATHNKVLALSSDSYLEIIAPDPDNSPPDRPRWMGLDDTHIIKQLEKSPRLLTWVVRTPNIKRSIAGAKEAGTNPGAPLSMSRGTLNWQIAIRDDGGLMEKGLLPMLIEWPASKSPNPDRTDHASEPAAVTSKAPEYQHPAAAMADLGLRLTRLELSHPAPNMIQDYLHGIGFERVPHFLEFRKASHRLVAHFSDLDGNPRTLASSA